MIPTSIESSLLHLRAQNPNTRKIYQAARKKCGRIQTLSQRLDRPLIPTPFHRFASTWNSGANFSGNVRGSTRAGLN
jgi:hypothetical protein